MGCAPLCDFARYHEPGEARSDLGLKNKQLERHDGCPASSLPTDASACAVLTEGRGLKLLLAFLHLSYPPPTQKKKSPFLPHKGLQRFRGPVQDKPSSRSPSHVPRLRKVRLSVRRDVSGCFQRQPAGAVFGQDEHDLLNWDFVSFNRFTFDLWLQSAAAATVPTGFLSSSSPTLQ